MSNGFPAQRCVRPLLRWHQMPDDHQHVVPQLLLRNFATGSRRNRQIWVFDKQTGKEFRTAVRNVATEGGFYDFVIDGRLHSLDPAMTRLESTVAADISAIVQNRAIPGDPEARVRLATFLSVQKLRTDAQRQQYFHLGELLRKTLENREGPQAASLIPKTSKERSYAEAERASTVVVNAYLQPVMQSYLQRLDTRMRQRGLEGAKASRVFVMQSSGGITSLESASRQPVRTVLSGPAGWPGAVVSSG